MECHGFHWMFPADQAEDEADVIRLANQTKYGLAGAVFTRDLEKAGAWHAASARVVRWIFGDIRGLL